MVECLKVWEVCVAGLILDCMIPKTYKTVPENSHASGMVMKGPLLLYVDGDGFCQGKGVKGDNII